MSKNILTMNVYNAWHMPIRLLEITDDAEDNVKVREYEKIFERGDVETTVKTLTPAQLDRLCEILDPEVLYPLTDFSRPFLLDGTVEEVRIGSGNRRFSRSFHNLQYLMEEPDYGGKDMRVLTYVLHHADRYLTETLGIGLFPELEIVEEEIRDVCNH